jgi:FeS assembly SUF system regulator
MASMLRITKEADYGIVLLAVMAEHAPGEIHTAREVAERSGLPMPMVSKIMRSLARGAVLTSHRGVTGGYSLDRSADGMTVAEVIRAIDGPISMVQCGVETGACEQEPVCPTRINWARISREVELALESIPVSEMLTAKDRREFLRIGNDSTQDGVENR